MSDFFHCALSEGERSLARFKAKTERIMCQMHTRVERLTTRLKMSSLCFCTVPDIVQYAVAPSRPPSVSV